MKKFLLLFIVIGLLSCRSSYKASYRATDMSGGLLRNVISEWPENIKETAVDMIRKYGQPYELTPTLLVWNNNGPWLKTVVSRDVVLHEYPQPHLDFLEQTIVYKATPEKYDRLARFDANVTADRTNGTLTAKCNKEELNFLALNLAVDVMNGKRKADEANEIYDWTAVRFAQGSSHPYLQRLQFEMSSTATLVKDRP